MFVLSCDLAGNDSRHRHSENPWVHSKQKNDPFVAVGPVLDVPGLVLDVPSVASPDLVSNLFM